MWITRALIHIGHKLRWQKVFDLADQSATKRPRWLAVAIRCQLTTTPQPTPSWFRAESRTPKALDAIMSFTNDEKKALELSPGTLTIAKSPKYYKGQGTFGGFNPENHSFRKRIFTQDDQLPTFMALYGSQHQLDQQLLEQHGFFGYFLALNFRKTGAPCLYKTLWPGKKAKVKSKVGTLRKKVKVKGKVKFLRLFCFCWCCDSINKNKMI